MLGTPTLDLMGVWRFSGLRCAKGKASADAAVAQPQGQRLLCLCPSATALTGDFCAYAAGPKLRKWYGEGERGAAVAQPARPGADGGAAPSVQRTAVLVTDADSATGEQVVLQLILARCGQAPALQGLCRRVADSMGCLGCRSSHTPLLLYLGPLICSCQPHMESSSCGLLQRPRCAVLHTYSCTGLTGRLLPARQEVRLLTRDPAAARSAFGEYVTPVEGHVGAPCAPYLTTCDPSASLKQQEPQWCLPLQGAVLWLLLHLHACLFCSTLQGRDARSSTAAEGWRPTLFQVQGPKWRLVLCLP